MKTIFTLLCLFIAFTARSASPSFTSFIGSNGVTVLSNAATGKIIISAAAGTGEENVNGESSVTNAARVGLVNGKLGVTNNLRSVQGGNGVTVTNQGTNIVLAITASVVPSQAELTASSNALNIAIIAATNSASVTNWIVLRQPASDNLTNWSAMLTSAITAKVNGQANSNLAYTIGTEGSNFAGTIPNQTNTSLTASTVLSADANKKITSIANGTGMLTNNGSGTVGYMAIPAGGGGGLATNAMGQQFAAYNLDVGLKKWFTQLGKSHTQAVDVIIAGNSGAEGTGSTDFDSRSWQALVRKAFQKQFGYTGYGIIPAYRGVQIGSSNFWTEVGSGWGTSGGNPAYGPFGKERFNSGSGNYASLRVYADNVDLMLVLWNLGTNAGINSANLQINGGASNYFNTFVTANRAYQNTNFSLGYLGWHDLQINSPLYTSGKSQLGIWGVKANVGRTGVRVHNIGRGGTKLEEFAPGPESAQFALGINGNGSQNFTGPSLTIMGMTSNDYSTQVDTNRFRTNLCMIANELGTNGSILFIGDLFRSGGGAIPQSIYHAIAREAAFTNRTPFAFIDFLERYNGVAASALAASGDDIHPNDRGHFDHANIILSCILPSPLPSASEVRVTEQTNEFVINVFETNSVGFPQEYSIGVTLTNIIASDKALATLLIDQDGDGTFERARSQYITGVAAQGQTVYFDATLSSKGRVCVTNQSSGGGVAAILPGTTVRRIRLQ